MGKRYYCAYCDRSFKDDPEARKRHLSSLQHAKNHADHYNMYKDPEIILKEERVKTPCKRYLTVGDCAFGLGCRFSHYTPQMLWELQQYVDMKNAARLHAMPEYGWPNPDDIIKDYFENTGSSNNIEEPNYSTWFRTLEVHDYSLLPPSLWPITPDSLPNNLTFNKWG